MSHQAGEAVKSLTEQLDRLASAIHLYEQTKSIDVYDTGIGIAQEQLPRIFEAFTYAKHKQDVCLPKEEVARRGAACPCSQISSRSGAAERNELALAGKLKKETADVR